MEDYKLVGRHVRVTWKTLPARTPHNEQTIFRGEVTHQENSGLWIWGDFFIEKAETMSVREVPRDKDSEDRLYFAPWGSIDVVQVIDEKTRDFEIHQVVISRRDEVSKNKI
jgi:hypothetical protein